MAARVRRILGAAILLIASVVTVTGDPAAATTFTPGAQGIGDPYFPYLGNGGYDVTHYTLGLVYEPSTHRLSGRAYITARATQNLSSFVLDLSGMTVRAVSVNKHGATWHRDNFQLVIKPRTGLVQGSTFLATVAYDGVPQTIRNSPLAFGGDYGWMYTNDGATVMDEPNAAHTWFPCNDHPRDKATFTMRMNIPSTKQVVANGKLTSRVRSGSRTIWTWDETKPMATYLATLDVGNWTFDGSYTSRGIRSLLAYDPSIEQAVRSRTVGAQTRTITDFWASALGGYPFEATGAIVDNAPQLGFALETQTRPVYGVAPDKYTMSHELAHQWFGDSVSADTWRAIWLNEGFATFLEWYWSYERTGSVSAYTHAKAIYDGVPSSDSLWHRKVADPGRDTMFSNTVYTRGGMALAALRHLIGPTTFWQILRTWAGAHKYSTGTTPEFTALAEQIAGRDLTPFFNAWLYSTSKPSSFDVH